MANVQQILRRYESLVDQRRTYEKTWQELADYILPRKSTVTLKRTPGRKQTDRLFSSTAVHANELLAATMQGTLTSPAIRWFRLKVRQEDLNEDQDVAEWLEAVTARIYLAIQQSNFGSEASEVYLDLGAFGTGAMLCEEASPERAEFAGLRFQALQIGSYAVSEDAEGRVNTLFRKFELPAHAIVQKWGEKAGETILKLASSKPDTMIEIVHGVYPRLERPGRTRKQKPFASCYVAYTYKYLIDEGGYDEFPYMVPRWTKSSGELYGRGPGHTALPDIKTLNKAVELTLRAWAKAIDPPMKVLHQGVIGQVRLTPASLNTVEDMNALAPIEFGAKFDVGQIKEQDLKSEIRDVWFVNQLQLPSGPQMTATEVERRYELMQRLLGPTLGRLEWEFENPLLKRVFGIMLRTNALPPVPQVLLESDADIDVEYEGPLARSQRSTEVTAIQRAYALLAGMAEMAPEVLDVMDHDENARVMAVAAGVPAKGIRSVKEIAERRQAKVEAQQQQNQLAQFSQMAESAGKAAPLVKALQPMVGAQGAAGAVPLPTELPR